MRSESTASGVAFLVANEGVEQVELTARGGRGGRRRAGADRAEAGEVQAFEHLDKADTFEATEAVADADAADYDGLVLPGGGGEPRSPAQGAGGADFTRGFFEAARWRRSATRRGCWSRGVVDGRTPTSFPSLRTDIRNAGGTWVDEEVHVEAAGQGSRVRRPRRVLREGDRGDLRGHSRRAARGDGRLVPTSVRSELGRGAVAARARDRLVTGVKSPTASSMPVSSSRRRTSASGQQTPKRRRSSDSRRLALDQQTLSPVESMNSQSLRSTRTAPVGRAERLADTDPSSCAVPLVQLSEDAHGMQAVARFGRDPKGAFKKSFLPVSLRTDSCGCSPSGWARVERLGC